MRNRMVPIDEDGEFREPDSDDLPDHVGDSADSESKSTENEEFITATMTDHEPIEALSVEAVRDRNDAVDDHIAELEKEISRLKEAREMTDSEDVDRLGDGSFDLRERTAD